jgi:ribulose kinase
MYVVGVDVGTSSARAAVFDLEGNLISSKVVQIDIWKYPKYGKYEQSAENIWSSVCQAVQYVTKGIKTSIKGIGFAATCSLVVLDQLDQEISVGDSGHNIVCFYF